MDADWYVDPLGRFDGRFFDGERWTERVSENGVLVVDHEFLTSQQVPTSHDVPSITNGANDDASAPAVSPTFGSEAPAVAPVNFGRQLQASLIEESPVRVVAVLDTSVRRTPETPPSQQSAKSGRTGVVWALLALIAALVVAALIVFGDDDPSVEADAVSIELDSEQEARVEDLEAGGIGEDTESEAIEELEVDAPAAAVAPGSSFDPSEAVDVGGLQVVNGTSVLMDLAEWHRTFAAERGIDLAPSASCWFGQLGGAAVQVAHCGPVGGSVDTEFLFDSVPLLFEEGRDGQIAQPVVDAVTIDAVVANALTLVGADGTTPSLSRQDAPG